MQQKTFVIYSQVFYNTWTTGGKKSPVTISSVISFKIQIMSGYKNQFATNEDMQRYLSKKDSNCISIL